MAYYRKPSVSVLEQSLEKIVIIMSQNEINYFSLQSFSSGCNNSARGLPGLFSLITYSMTL